MHAAVVDSFDRPPVYREFRAPQPTDDSVEVDVIASAIHPRVRSQAAGSHYTSTTALPLIPGIDGVGRTADGVLRYFLLPDTDLGAMAERTLIDPRRSIVMPEGIDPVVIAAAMNPAMSSWVALRRRIELPEDARVLVLGATGSAGRIAVQIAKHLGAAHVTAVGRDARKLARLPALGADSVVDLTRDPEAGLAEAGRDLDVVVDYLWGEPAAVALRAIVPARADDDRLLSWIAIGSTAGAESAIPSAALRATNLRIVGSGQGSVPTRGFLEELPALADEVTRGGYAIAARAVPLRDVTAAWAEAPTTDDRLVLVPA